MYSGYQTLFGPKYRVFDVPKDGNYEIKKERKVIEANNNRSGVGALRDNADKLITDNKQRADMLNQFFGSVGSQDDGNIPRHEISS